MNNGIVLCCQVLLLLKVAADNLIMISDNARHKSKQRQILQTFRYCPSTEISFICLILEYELI